MKIGKTPLHEAASNGRLEVCRLIIDSVRDKNPERDDGVTPLDLAISKGHKKVMNLFQSIYKRQRLDWTGKEVQKYLQQRKMIVSSNDCSSDVLSNGH